MILVDDSGYDEEDRNIWPLKHSNKYKFKF